MSNPQDAASPAGRRLDEAVLGALFSRFPFGLHILDTELRIVRFNSAAQYAREFPLDDMVGWPLGEALRRFAFREPETLEGMARRVLETGEPIRGFEVRIRTPIDPRFEAVVSVSWFRLQDETGHVLGLAALTIDATDRHRAQARLRLLDEAGAHIGTTLDVLRTGQELADAAVPGLADTVSVDVLDSVLRGDAPPPGPMVGSLPMRRVGYSSHDGNHAQSAAGRADEGLFGSQYRQSLADLRPRLIRRLDADPEWLAGEPTRVRKLLTAGVHSLMVVPMAARGVVLGLCCFYRSRQPVAYEEDDLALGAQLAARAALCLDNARLYSRELSAARILRTSVRHPEVPKHAAVETAYSHRPASAGGGWFDVIPLSGARVALVAGDTADRNVRSAVGMGELRAAISALSDLDLPPDELLERLHGLVTRLGGERPSSAEGRPEGSPGGGTCLYVIYDPVSRQCTMSTAGHPPPVIAYPDGRMEAVDLPDGPPLGRGIARYTGVEQELPEGSILVLYDDAVLQVRPEATRQERLDRLRGALAAAHGSLQDNCDNLLRALTHDRPEHDAVLLLARTRVLDADHVASWALPNHPASVAQARRVAVDQLATWGLQELGFSTELVVSELVTNAVRYADGPIGLRLIRDHALICEVTDDASTAPQLRRADDADEGGRGLYITSQVTQRWGHRPTRRGKTIWTEQDLPGPARI
ncbi:SpoIIE family protein phosphatase [Streptomyces sp. NPDC096354]|uniref:ATP-binding SpoIIE family protein phosphatase n=1 Tax=Streptomyces sp. NPDC096354 TaxID=3366088 RepID=UPI00380A9EE0